jgi:hypothetical protein
MKGTYMTLQSTLLKPLPRGVCILHVEFAERRKNYTEYVPVLGLIWNTYSGIRVEYSVSFDFP